MKRLSARHAAIGSALCTLSLFSPAAAEEWKQVGYFRSDGRNVSVGDTVVRVVSAVDVQRLDLKGDPVGDSTLIARFYPGWDYTGDLVVYYTLGPTGYRQSSFEYRLGAEREALPLDTIPAHLGVFDHSGTRLVKVPAPLRETLADTALLVAASAYNWDSDEEVEWLVITSGPRAGLRKAAPQSIRLYDRTGGQWTVQKTVELRDAVRTGPLELRDVTGDGRPDFVYRCFLETPGHFWVDVHILSRHAGFSAAPLPAVFKSVVATGPLE